ncbi:MAG: hypothetical protein JWQ87_5457 [Candidatus Sulfotelmatobacter sp.]|nr:hypothetical protein [Candidatus Sulfotelmatobacter sp.]
MSTQPVVEEVVAPPVPPVVEAPDPKKFSRTIQPKDSEGKSIGAPHVYHGATEQEVADKMADAISNGTLKIHELTRKATVEQTALAVPEGAEMYEELPQPHTRDLSLDERTALAAKFSKPETVVEAYRELVHAVTGLSPEEDARLKVSQAQDARRTAVVAEAQKFDRAHRDYLNETPAGLANGKTIMQYVQSRKMALTEKNFELAFRELNANGLLTVATPEVVPPPVPAVPVEEVRTEPVEEPAQSVIPSALKRSDASGGGAPARKKGPTPKELAMMTPAQLRAHYEATGQWPTK